MSVMPVYLDNAATTPVLPEVAQRVIELMTVEFGNAGSRTHDYGLLASREVEQARERIGHALSCRPDEVVFTSGATESDNIAVLGLAAHGRQGGRLHVVSTAIEHKAVLEPLARLAREGFEVTLLRPDRDGHVDAAEVLAAVRPDTLLVSVMHANNETGAVQPVQQIAEGLETEGAFLHVDAAQSVGRLTKALRHPRIDLVSVSGHKVFGPKGVGALLARRRAGRRLPIEPLMVGGGQERGLRPGTLPVPLIAGLGLAVEIAIRDETDRAKACEETRKAALAAFLPLGAKAHGDPARGVLPNILSIAIPGVDSEAFMVAARGLAALSNGSACTSASYEPSHVLLAMGLDEGEAGGTVRLSWSHLTGPVPWKELASRVEDLRF